MKPQTVAKKSTVNSSTSPDHSMFPEGHSSKRTTTTASIGVDTADLTPPKKVPPPTLPKPRVDVAELKRQNLEVEFQFCLGHEPEYRPGDEQPFIVKNDRLQNCSDTRKQAEMIGQCLLQELGG